MNCHHLMYKPYRTSAPYQRFIQQLKEQNEQAKKEEFYQEILKFRQSRYPLQFLQKLQEDINPFKLSLEKLKEQFSARYPEYSNQLVNESVEHIFNRKCQESEMIKESTVVIEYGDEEINIGRKLIKEDFSYEFSKGNKYGGNNSKGKVTGAGTNAVQTAKGNKNQGPGTSRGPEDQDSAMKALKAAKSQNQTDRGHQQTGSEAPNTDRDKGSQLPTDRSFMNNKSSVGGRSENKIMDMMKRTQRFNNLLQMEIHKDKQRFENLDDIEECSPNDSLYYRREQFSLTERSHNRNNDSMPSFRESDLVVRADTVDTGRSEVEELNFLLGSLNYQEGHETRRSKKSQTALRINREIKEQLFTVKGSLKLDLVRKAVYKLKKETEIETAKASSLSNQGM